MGVMYLDVMVIELWPRRLLIVGRSTPRAFSIVPKVCRKSWIRRFLMPAFLQAVANALRKLRTLSPVLGSHRTYSEARGRRRRTSSAFSFSGTRRTLLFFRCARSRQTRPSSMFTFAHRSPMISPRLSPVLSARMMKFLRIGPESSSAPNRRSLSSMVRYRSRPFSLNFLTRLQLTGLASRYSHSTALFSIVLRSAISRFIVAPEVFIGCPSGVLRRVVFFWRSAWYFSMRSILMSDRNMSPK